VRAREYKRGRYELYNQSLQIAKKIGYQEQIAMTLNNIAMIYDSRGEYEQIDN
jgi:hypothetical protein